MQYLDKHTILTAVLVVALVVLAILDKIDGSVALAAIVAAVSPGLVFKTKSDRETELLVESLRPPSPPERPPPPPPMPPTTKDAA